LREYPWIEREYEADWMISGEATKKAKVQYPADHKAGMRVPEGGSMCANCEYLKDAEKGLCGNNYFVKWNGSDKIPAPIHEYCSDFYEPAKAD